MGFIEQLVALLQREHDPTHEHLLAAILALTRDHQPSVEECRRPEFLFRELLENRIEMCTGRDECQVVFVIIVGNCFNIKTSIVNTLGGSGLLSHFVVRYLQGRRC